MLIIACPCALGLATPAALVVASGRGAQLGIFIKGYQALESSRAINTVVLDETGTVTTGKMTAAAVRTVPGTSRTDLLRYAGSVEQASEHAVAAAVTALAVAESASLASAEGFAALPGLGARGVVDGHEVIVGRSRLFADRGIEVPATWRHGAAPERGGCTAVLVSWDDLMGRAGGGRHGQAVCGCGRGRPARPGPASGPADRRRRRNHPGRSGGFRDR